MSDKDKIEQSERAWKLFDPEGYANHKAAEQSFWDELTSLKKHQCPECGSRMKCIDSMYHLVPILHCGLCGYEAYE